MLVEPRLDGRLAAQGYAVGPSLVGVDSSWGGRVEAWWRQDYQDDAETPKWAYSIWSYYGYDGNVDNNCNNNPSWSVFYDQDLYAGIPDTTERVLVYNQWCKFTKSDMKLHCPSWADAICSDITETVGGTCEISATLKQCYNGLVRCKWS